ARLHEKPNSTRHSARRAAAMSDDFQRGLQARLAHLIGEASQWARGSGAHPPGLVKALNEAFEYGCAEIERLQRERDELQQSFDLHWRASMRAIKRWQEAHPGSDLTWPDHADLVVWLLEQLDAAREAEGRSDE